VNLGAGLGKELAFGKGAECRGEQFAQAVGGELISVDGGQTDDAILVGECIEAVVTEGRAIGELIPFLEKSWSIPSWCWTSGL
jgi:hypothetical protein